MQARMNGLILVVCSMALVACFGDSACKVSKVKNPLTIDRLYSSPKLDGEQLKNVQVSPDGKRITYLKGKDKDFRMLDLWEWNVQAGAETLLVDSQKLLGEDKEELSDEEKARRERKRVSSQGIVEYGWSKQGDRILFPLKGDLYIYTIGAKEPLLQLTETEDAELDARFSPKGKYVSFVRKNNLYVINLSTKKETQVTFKGTKEKPMAVAEFVAQEEMSRHRGYWWSPDETYIALTQVDETPVGVMTRLEAYPSGIKVVEQRYPKTGGVNAIVKLGVVQLLKSGVQWIQWKTEDYYIPHVQWMKSEESPTLTFMLQTRDQKQLELVSYNPKTKEQKTLITEKDRAWVDIRHDHIYLKDQILWLSEKTGYHHIHSYDLEGKELKALTSGKWEVTQLHSVDEEKGKVYFSARLDSPLESHLYVVDLKGGEPVKLTQQPGIHNIAMTEKPAFFVDHFSALDQPPTTTVYDMSGKTLFKLTDNKVDKEHPLTKYWSDLGNWEFDTLKLDSGEELHYKILKPKDFDPRKKYPLIHAVYGGPGVQLVNKGWGGSRELFQQLLAQKGFIILVSDNRGTPHRGRDFEREYYLKLGRLEVEDQSKVLEHVMKKNKFIDEKRVGIYGHSYGGYLTLMMLFQRPDLYHVGVSGAPVVDWKLYDTHYTERFLGHPKDNEAFYLKSNVLTYANSFRGRLLVLHGMADDNVLYNHSLLLYQELQKRGKVFDIMAYPGAKHGIRGKERETHYAQSILQYFTDHLVKGI